MTMPAEPKAAAQAPPAAKPAATPTAPTPSKPTPAGQVAANAAANAGAAAPKPKSWGFTMTKPARLQRHINVLFYGPYGAGKSSLAGTADDVKDMKDVLYIDAEGGDLALQDRTHLDVVRVTTYRQFARVVEFLKVHCQARDAGDIQKLKELEASVKGCDPEDIEEPRMYRTVVLDSLSEVFKYCMYQLTGVQIGRQPLDMEPTRPEFKEWNAATDMIRMLVRAFRDMPINFIIVCSEKAEEVNGRKEIGLNLPKALATEVPGFLDLVGYLAVTVEVAGNTQKTVRRLWVEPGRGFGAKNRLGMTGHISAPSLAKIVEKIKAPDKSDRVVNVPTHGMEGGDDDLVEADAAQRNSLPASVPRAPEESTTGE